MSVRRLLLALACVLALSSSAQAQAPDELLPSFQVAAQYAPNRFDAVEQVDRACPGLVLSDHAFTDAVATVLNREDARWGRNGKRGNPNDPSHDALFYRGFYRGGPSPFGGAVIDIIAAAGGPDARPAWQDVTDATIAAGTVGAWVAPSGVLPACLATSPTPVDPPIVTPPQPPLVLPDLEEVLVALRSIEHRLAVLERVQHAQVVDLKERTDVLRVSLEQLDAWLRGRRVLRY
jgi:hypothetical protein